VPQTPAVCALKSWHLPLESQQPCGQLAAVQCGPSATTSPAASLEPESVVESEPVFESPFESVVLSGGEPVSVTVPSPVASADSPPSLPGPEVKSPRSDEQPPSRTTRKETNRDQPMAVLRRELIRGLRPRR
jgi:hypothetical protein